MRDFTIVDDLNQRIRTRYLPLVAKVQDGFAVVSDAYEYKCAVADGNTCIVAKPGEYVFAEKMVDTRTKGHHFSLVGCGRDVTRFIFDCNDGGFEFNLDNGVRQNGTTFTFTGASIETTENPETAGTALVVNGNNVQGMTAAGPIVRDLELRGVDESVGWSNGIRYFDVSSTATENVKFTGKASTYFGTAFYYGGLNYPVDQNNRGCRAYFCHTGVSMDGKTEGLNVDFLTTVAVTYGVNDISSDTNRPLMSVTNSHLNAGRAGIASFTGCAQGKFIGNTIYEWESLTTPWSGIEMANSGEITVVANDIMSFRRIRQKVGILLGNSRKCRVGFNNLRGDEERPMSIGIQVNNCLDTIVDGTNTFDGVAVEVSNTNPSYNVYTNSRRGYASGSCEFNADGAIVVRCYHMLGRTPDPRRLQPSCRFTSGAGTAMVAHIGDVTSSYVDVAVVISNIVLAGTVQVNIYCQIG